MIEISNTKDLGRLVREFRKRAHLSQTHLAELAGLSRTAIQTTEDGKETTQLDTIFKVLKVLNVHLHLDHPLISEVGQE